MAYAPSSPFFKDSMRGITQLIQLCTAQETIKNSYSYILVYYYSLVIEFLGKLRAKGVREMYS